MAAKGKAPVGKKMKPKTAIKDLSVKRKASAVKGGHTGIQALLAVSAAKSSQSNGE